MPDYDVIVLGSGAAGLAAALAASVDGASVDGASVLGASVVVDPPSSPPHAASVSEAITAKPEIRFTLLLTMFLPRSTGGGPVRASARFCRR